MPPKCPVCNSPRVAFWEEELKKTESFIHPRAAVFQEMERKARKMGEIIPAFSFSNHKRKHLFKPRQLELRN